MPRNVIAVFVLASSVACFGDRATFEKRPDGVERSNHGDTVVVTTTGPGVWGPAHDAIEVLRVGGGSKETTFGSVYVLAATPDGGVVLFDSKSADGMVARQFDANGTFVRNIGRRGTGPGEYDQPGQIILAAHPSGVILLRDGSRVVNRYAKDGRFLNGFTLGFGSAGLEVVAAVDGSIYLRGPLRRGGLPTDIQPIPAMLHYDSTGALVDSVVDGKRWMPQATSRSQFAPQSAWSVLPDAHVYFWRSDKLGFLLVDPLGKSPPLIAEANAAPVEYLPEERAELEAVEEFKRKHHPASQQQARVDIPKYKLPAGWPMSDIDNRIWIAKSSTGEKGTPRVAARTGPDSVTVSYTGRPTFVAFQTDGTFLGEIRFPMGVWVPTFVGNSAWAIVPTEDDVPVLVKYKLHQ